MTDGQPQLVDDNLERELIDLIFDSGIDVDTVFVQFHTGMLFSVTVKERGQLAREPVFLSPRDSR